MAKSEKKGLIAQWLIGKERSEEYARGTLPTSRWALFWDIMKGRFGKIVLVNFFMLITCLPIIAIIVMRVMGVLASGATGPYGSGLGVGYPVLPELVGYAEKSLFYTDLVWFALLIPASAIAALGISGGGYIIRNLIWTEGIFVANDFLRGIKRNYLNVLEALLFFTIVMFFVRMTGNLVDMYVAMGVGSAGWLITSKVFGYVFLVFALFVTLWMIALGISYKQGPWALIRNAVIMTFGTFPQTIVFTLAATWPILIMLLGVDLLTVVGATFMLFLGISYLLLVWLDFAQWAFDKYVNPNKGFATGKGLYNRNAPSTAKSDNEPTESESEALREYRRRIVAMGKSKLVCRPIKPIDDELEVYQLPESFSREDLRRLRESKEAIAEDTSAYEEEHKNDERYVEYNRQFEERERALQSAESDGKKKKPPQPPKMLNKR